MICFLFLLVEIIKVKIFFMEINVVFILKYLEFFVYFFKIFGYLYDVFNEKFLKIFLILVELIRFNRWGVYFLLMDSYCL